MNASALADAAGLTRGAMTTALDRLEAAGYVRRVWLADRDVAEDFGLAGLSQRRCGRRRRPAGRSRNDRDAHQGGQDGHHAADLHGAGILPAKLVHGCKITG